MKVYRILLSFCLLLAFNNNAGKEMIRASQSNGNGLTLLALGDSYTVGESVSELASFPYQLISELKALNISLNVKPKVIAKTGWTTDELQAAIQADDNNQNYDIVTLLIGVNNQYRDYSKITYRKEFAALLQTAINFAGSDKKKVFVVSIPDWGVTPFGKDSGRNAETIAAEIDAFNAINKELTLSAGVSYTDITPGSRLAASDLSLVATDGLHPSGKMYKAWAAKVAAAVAASFK